MFNEQDLESFPSCVRLADGAVLTGKNTGIEQTWTGNLLETRVANRSGRPLRIKEIVLFAGELPFSAETPFYGEGFQMLCQYTGTLAEPRLIGAYGTDWDFFRLPKTVFNADLWTVYDLLMLSPVNQGHLLMAFASCRRFSGEFRFKGSYLEVVMDTEDLTLEPGQSWHLESFIIASGADRELLLRELAASIDRKHPHLAYPEIPSGWCSFYCLRPMTADGLYENAESMAARIPELQRIQIDGGYSDKNGDWLVPNTTLGADVKSISGGIRARGVEAAGYLSPFIVDRESRLFREHPDWLVRDESGEPFNEIGHKRDWYMIDGSNPEACEHVRTAVRFMHDEWGWRYFKLDFLAYGALPGGKRHNPDATRVEAFRALVGAIVDEVGGDSFILGCNAPFWPILGLVHGNRIGNDAFRDWKHVSGNAQEIFWRNWQNGTLWYNDPDVLLLEKLDLADFKNWQTVIKKSTLTDPEFEFHKASIVASGGMILSGDLIPSLSEDNIRILKKLLPPSGVAARFDDTAFTVGRIGLADRQVICLFNWEETELDLQAELDGTHSVYDFWTDREVGVFEGKLRIPGLEPHGARVLYYKL